MEMNINEIRAKLPHRYPMLLVDRIVELELRTRVKAYKNVTANEAFFQGHYPDMPIMPGVLIVESIAQAAALMLLADPEHAGSTPLLAGIDNVKFRKPVVPGDRLDIVADVVWFRNKVGQMKGVASVGDEIAAEAEILFKILENGAKI